jgi:hypothetical protein
MIVPPTLIQLDSWTTRLNALISECGEEISTFDLHTVLDRIAREKEKRRTLEGGCAFRVMRVAVDVRRTGDLVLSAAFYDLARELIAHECGPSPRWSIMCFELEFQFIPTNTEND